MASQVISFRASAEFAEWLQQQQSSSESLSQTAQRLLKGMMESEQPPTPVTASTPVDSSVNIETVQSRIDLAIAQLREELMGELNA